MNEKFNKLDKEKQGRILNAAIQEFARKGFENASTNEMVKEAGISKGLLFHYFKSKKQLFLFLFDYFIDVITNEFYQKVDLSETDFFERIKQASFIKMELLKKFPDIFHFLETAYMEDSAALKMELDERKKELTAVNMNKIFEGINFSKFRDDVDVLKAVKIITWTFESLGNEEVQRVKALNLPEIDYKLIFAEVNEYTEFLKKCFYKEPGGWKDECD